MKYLLDTHVLLQWVADDRALSPKQRRILRAATVEKPLLVASISLWEIAMLVEKRRVRLTIPLRDWLENAVIFPNIRVVDLTPAIAAEVTALPADLHGDPADRILLATARLYAATLLSRDTRIVKSGLVEVVS